MSSKITIQTVVKSISQGLQMNFLVQLWITCHGCVHRVCQAAVKLFSLLLNQQIILPIKWHYKLQNMKNLKLLLLSTQQSKTQRPFIHYHKWQRNTSKSLHLRSWNQQIFDTFGLDQCFLPWLVILLHLPLLLEIFFSPSCKSYFFSYLLTLRLFVNWSWCRCFLLRTTGRTCIL